MQKITISFIVNSEQVPGLFYDPNDFLDVVKRDIENTLMAYRPRNILGKVEKPSLMEPDHELGYTQHALIEYVGWDQFKKFKSWMEGKTVGLDKDSKPIYYGHDVQKFFVSTIKHTCTDESKPVNY